MRAVVQRVQRASVTYGDRTESIGEGLLVLLGVARGDGFEEANWMAHRIARLRVFPDASQKMRHAVIDHGFDVLVISQFTLLADTSAGHRPSFVSAAPPEVAEPLYEHVVQQLQEADGVGSVKKGMFGQHMQVDLVNDGPVTIMLERAPSPPHQQC
jgi:D-tyrosyl-tRNA(Tyr) deacylase